MGFQFRQLFIIKLLFLSVWLVTAGCATYCSTGKTNKQTASWSPAGQCGDGPGISSPAGPASTPGERSQQEILDSAIEFCEVSNDYWQRGDLDNAIDALDQAYSLILTINPNRATPEILQQKEDLRFTISKRIAEVYASRFTVANGLHKAIPLDMNIHVEKALELFKGRERDFFLNAYRRSGRYRPAIIRALNEAGMPDELSWLPLIESGFKTRAFSKARALGMWQFIASTGYKFGLKRGPYEDERMDPEKSTSAAIAYLKELHQIFGDWTTVLAAYNCGEGRVLDLIRTQRVNYLDNFWDLYTKLPEETAFYVPSFMAVLHIVNDPEAHGFTLPPVDKEIEFDKVPIEKKVHLQTMAKHLEIPYDTLKGLNPALRQHCTPDRPYELNVPKGKGDMVCAKLADIPGSYSPASVCVSQKVHKVQKGETLFSIASRYKTSVKAIMALNHLKRENSLKAGWKLKIPTSGSYAATHNAAPAASKTPVKKPEKYVVRKGDSLYKIARRFGTTTHAIQSLNHLNLIHLHIGQVIKIPTKASGSLPSFKTKSYKVVKGDSSHIIAQKHRMSLSEFLTINELTHRSTIYAGQILLVKAQ